jgi:hypothetical protein
MSSVDQRTPLLALNPTIVKDSKAHLLHFPHFSSSVNLKSRIYQSFTLYAVPYTQDDEHDIHR